MEALSPDSVQQQQGFWTLRLYSLGRQRVLGERRQTVTGGDVRRAALEVGVVLQLDTLPRPARRALVLERPLERRTDGRHVEGAHRRAGQAVTGTTRQR